MRAPTLATALTLAFTLGCDTEPQADPDASTADASPPDSGADARGAAQDAAQDASTGSGPDAEVPPDPRAFAGCAPYSVPGPYAPGVTTIEVDGELVEVWYPATPGAQDGVAPAVYDLRSWLPGDLAAQIPDEEPTRFTTSAYRDITPSTQGPFPLVVFSHGFAGYRMQSTFLTSHLATWGFVVAAVEHPERGLAAVLEGDLGGGSGADVAAAVGAAAALEVRGAPGAPGALAGLVSPGGLVGVVGHSAGGATSIAAAAIEGSPFDSVVGLAPAVSGFDGSTSPVSEVPTAVLLGETDRVTRAGPIVDYYGSLTASPRQLVSLAGGGHLVFSDICLIGKERGGIARIARENGLSVPVFVLNLAQDGCRPGDLDPRAAFPIINHMTTAHLRVTLSGDSAALPSQDLGACFGDLVDTLELIDGPAR